MEQHIGNNIKRLSEEKNIKVQEIAYKWKKSTQQVYNLFKNDDPTASVVFEIAGILGVTLKEIYGIEEKSMNNNINASSSLNNLNYDLVKELTNQLKVKDEQIKTLLEVLKVEGSK